MSPPIGLTRPEHKPSLLSSSSAKKTASPHHTDHATAPHAGKKRDGCGGAGTTRSCLAPKSMNLLKGGSLWLARLNVPWFLHTAITTARWRAHCMYVVLAWMR